MSNGKNPFPFSHFMHRMVSLGPTIYFLLPFKKKVKTFYCRELMLESKIAKSDNEKVILRLFFVIIFYYGNLLQTKIKFVN